MYTNYVLSDYRTDFNIHTSHRYTSDLTVRTQLVLKAVMAEEEKQENTPPTDVPVEKDAEQEKAERLAAARKKV